MEFISRALQRAKTGPQFKANDPARPIVDVGVTRMQHERSARAGNAVSLSSEKLLTRHIAAHDSTHRITRSYDVLRNQLEALNEGRSPGVLAVTAPTVGCGTTTAALNLAFSFARGRDANVLLIDANGRTPSLGKILGQSIAHSGDTHEYLALEQVDVDGVQLHVFSPRHEGEGTPAGRAGIAHLSRQIDTVRRSLNPSITILDLPPLLDADEAGALAANADTVVLVLAVGHSKVAELEMCKAYLDPRSSVQVVLNKCRRHGL